MTVWIVNPFDNLPTEGFRPQRYWLMAEAFARASHRVVYWTSDFNHGTKERRRSRGEVKVNNGDKPDCVGEPYRDVEKAEGLGAFKVVQIPTRPYGKNVCWARVLSHRQLARDFEKLADKLLHPSLTLTSPLDLTPHPSTSTSNLDLSSSTSTPRFDSPPPDLLIASTPPLGLCDAARRVAKRCGAKFVCDIQDAWPETFARLLPRGFKWLGAILFAPMRRTARRLYREADLVTGVSARYAQLARRDDFHLAYHGIESSCALASHASGSFRRLVYIGNLGAGYDLETAIDAVARRESLTLDIAGRGPKESALRAHVARHGLDARVRFHGYLGSDALRNLLSDCDVGLVPMRNDSWVGLPYKLGDYLKAGLPVLSSLGGECGELLERTCSERIYAPGDPDSLLRALDALPRVDVALPSELRAEEIYPQYVRAVENRCLNRP